MWELCVCDLAALFVADESACETVECLQRPGCSESLQRTVVVVWQAKATPPIHILIHWICVFVPVKRSTCGHAPGKAFDALLSKVRDGSEIGGHEGQWVWRVHKEAIFPEDHVPVLKNSSFSCSIWIWIGNKPVDADRINITFVRQRQ